MGQVVEEVRLWNTPVVGAFLLYKFTDGYQRAHHYGDAPVAILHFLASAILTSDDLKMGVSDRRSSLQSYIMSFEDGRRSDLLLSIHQRLNGKLEYTWKSIDIAVASGLLFWDVDSGKLYPASDSSPKVVRGTAPRAEMRRDGERAEILGKWFAAHDLPTIMAYFKIVL